MATSRARRVEADDSSGPVIPIEDTDKMIDEVPAQTDYRKLFADEAFMNERVKIFLHPGPDASEVGVPVSVNGIRAYIVPGRPALVRRFHIAQLLKARPDVVIHRSDDHTVPEHELNRLYRQNTSRYNFDVLEDTPKGAAWIRELRSQYQSR